MQLQSSTLLLLVSLILVLCPFSTLSIHIEINNIHNGYKLILQGKSGLSDRKLMVNPVQILQNTLPQEDKLDFMEFFGHKIMLDVSQLAQAYEHEQQFIPVITTYWSKRREILVTFTFSEDNNIHEQNLENLFKFILDNTKAYSDEDF